MPTIEIYTTGSCPFCVRAKALFEDKGMRYEEYRIEGDRGRMREMLKRCREKTVPQVFIDDTHIGGYDELSEMNESGRLDRLLGLDHAAG